MRLLVDSQAFGVHFAGYAGRLNIKNTLDVIHNEYRQITEREYWENRGGTNAQVFLLIIPKGRPQQPQGMTEREMEDMFKDFYRTHPGNGVSSWRLIQQLLDRRTGVERMFCIFHRR